MLDRVREILAQYTEITAEQIAMESDLSADLGLNSLDVVEIVVAFEEAFEINISDRDIGKLRTVGDILELIKN